MTSVQKQTIPVLLQGKDALVRSQTGSAHENDRLGSLAWDCCDTDRCCANFCNDAVVGLNADVQLPAIAYGLIPRLMLGMQIQGSSGAKQLTLLSYKLIYLLYSKLCLISHGKTLAYGIPLVQSLQGMKPKIQRSDGPYALILVPTRELALQSFETMQKLLKPFAWVVPGVLMGGEKRKSEKARLRKGINILISTPGRLVDHIKSTECIHFRRTQWLIIDEADRILDLGFEKDIAVILNALNAERETRQNVLLSATLTEGVTRLADISLNDPISISIADKIQDRLKPASQEGKEAISSSMFMDQENFAVPEKLKQYVIMVPSKLRLVTLAAFILEKCKFEKRNKMIVFFSSCEQVEFHYELLLKVLSGGLESEQRECLSVSSAHFQFLRLHGNMEQEERTEVFQEFLKSKTGILLCTDVAARGLDLPQVTWIIQYNAPASPAEYIHRIGRTARIGCHGNSLLVLAPSEAEYVSLLASHKINRTNLQRKRQQREGTSPLCGAASPPRRPSHDAPRREPRSRICSAASWQRARRGEDRRGGDTTQTNQCRSVSEIKMEKVLSSLMKDNRFKLPRSGNKKSCGTDPQEVRERATVLQTKFENYVHSSEGTVRWAKKAPLCGERQQSYPRSLRLQHGASVGDFSALQSFLCAYTTYPRNLKHIFHIKSLHLGHVAKSFGLRDAPQNLSALPAVGSKKKIKARQKRPDLLKKTHGKHRLAEILRSEYSSGMDTGVSKVKKKKKQRKPGNQKIPT
ncbi:probable ATP-dependent RNA helicase DDX31 [Apteryx rowi]|uniref:probable ATP-dependent RNA helicase DDX31 n=1 Tax=Apteryx rowi TaxID=308060 RepID=UPI000E1C77F6|nr:probable ATP-dependent RNA helicase DDX31 [Apteryx rowi]